MSTRPSWETSNRTASAPKTRVSALKWVFAAFSADDSRKTPIPVATREFSSLRDCRKLIEENSCGQIVAVLEPGVQELFASSAASVLSEIAGHTGLVGLLPRGPVPECGARMDGPVRSFVCDRTVLRQLLAASCVRSIDRLFFHVLLAAMNLELRIERILVRQVPADPVALRAMVEPLAVIMPHRGDPSLLQSALEYLSLTHATDLHVRVGLDTNSTAKFKSVLKRYPHTDFFQFWPSPAGPYRIRQELAMRSSETILSFHDSDDISCHDRFPKLLADMRATDCDFIGCHELRVDEQTGEVTAIRFPLQVSRALRIYPGHQLWLPTAIITRSAFLEVGGFSTDRIIANDTQFLLRAGLRLHIRNSDAFLYIRRKHAKALTVARATKLGIPVREQLAESWGKDFRAIEEGRCTLKESSLKVTAGSGPVHCRQLTPPEA